MTMRPYPRVYLPEPTPDQAAAAQAMLDSLSGQDDETSPPEDRDEVEE